MYQQLSIITLNTNILNTIDMLRGAGSHNPWFSFLKIFFFNLRYFKIFLAPIEFKIMKSNWFIASNISSPWHNDFTNDNLCYCSYNWWYSSAYAVCSDLQLEVILDFLISEQQDSSPGSDVHSWNSWRVWTVYLSTKQF